MNKIKQFDKVKLLTSEFEKTDGIQADSIGYVIEIHNDGNLEIEFSDSNGITKAIIVAPSKDVELILQ